MSEKSLRITTPWNKIVLSMIPIIMAAMTITVTTIRWQCHWCWIMCDCETSRHTLPSRHGIPDIKWTNHCTRKKCSFNQNVRTLYRRCTELPTSNEPITAREIIFYPIKMLGRCTVTAAAQYFRTTNFLQSFEKCSSQQLYTHSFRAWVIFSALLIFSSSIWNGKKPHTSDGIQSQNDMHNHFRSTLKHFYLSCDQLLRCICQLFVLRKSRKFDHFFNIPVKKKRWVACAVSDRCAWKQGRRKLLFYLRV